MPNNNLAYDQRLVCVGLRKMTKDTALIRSGFLYWHKTFAGQEFDIDKIVSSLVDYLGVGVGEKKTLLLTLHSASNKLFDELPPVPAVLLNMLEGETGVGSGFDVDDQADSGSDKVIAAKPAHCIVTDEFLYNLTGLIKKFDRDDLSELKFILVEENIDGLRDDLHNAVRKWAGDGFGRIDFPADTTEDECYEIAHGIYMLMVELIGPVESDRIIDRVIDETFKIDAASRFSPRKLL